MKNHIEIFQLMMLHTKKHMVQSLKVLFSIKQKDIRKYDRTKNLALIHFDKKYERSFNKIRYLITLKSTITDVYSQKNMKTKLNQFTFRKNINFT